MKSAYLMSLDQGTTGTTAILLDATDPTRPKLLSQATATFEQYYPREAWVEHDLEQIWASVRKASLACLEQAKALSPAFHPNKILALGITNQRETWGLFAAKSSAPLRRAIVWQCKRSADLCLRLREEGHEALIKAKTGLILDPYFSGSKALWLLQQDPQIRTKLKSGEALWGTIDSYLIHRLTQGQSFATEPSNASRTLLFDIQKGAYDTELCGLFGIEGQMGLAPVQDSASLFGKTKGLDFLPDGIAISGVLGDQQAALFGQGCFAPGAMKCTYGTGAFQLMNTGTQLCRSDSGLITTVAWSINQSLSYALEGSTFIAGAMIQFLRDQWGLITKAEESESLARGGQGAPQLYVVPALSGLGAPYWEPKAKGLIVGLTRGTTKADLLRATLEGLAFQVRDLQAAMQQSFPHIGTQELRVDGGAARNRLLLQIQADICALPIAQSPQIESTAWGAALIAGLGIGLYKDLGALGTIESPALVLRPQWDSTQRSLALAGWQRAVKATLALAQA